MIALTRAARTVEPLPICVVKSRASGVIAVITGAGDNSSREISDTRVTGIASSRSPTRRAVSSSATTRPLASLTLTKHSPRVSGQSLRYDVAEVRLETHRDDVVVLVMHEEMCLGRLCYFDQRFYILVGQIVDGLLYTVTQVI